MTYVKHLTKHFPGGNTTATILDCGDGNYRTTVITRFDSGNYLKEVDEKGLSLTKATEYMNVYAGN